MCLITNKFPRINIFPKTTYKVVKYKDNNNFISLYTKFKYKKDKTYKVSIRNIFKHRIQVFRNINIKHYTFGFHSYIQIEDYEFKKLCNAVIVKCKIPAFSLIIYGTGYSKGQILSNKIKIVEIINKHESITREEAMKIAKHYSLEQEVEQFINKGYKPCEALYECDLPFSLDKD